MKSVYHRMLQELDRGRGVVWARVARRDGSAPRSVGAACLVFRDGTLHGSVGGGHLESRVAEEGMRLLERGGTHLLSYRLQQQDAAENGMICGGDVDILMECISPESGGRDAVAQAARLLDQGLCGVQCSFVPQSKSVGAQAGQALLDENGECWGDLSIPDKLRQVISSRKDPALVTTQEGSLYFIDPVRSRPALVIFGGGHVSLPLARMASEVHFRVIVVDDRQDFANKERFPFADQVLAVSFTEAFDRLAISQDHYLAIVTRGHIYDRDVLRLALQTRAAYIGMIGSRKKIQAIFDTLRREGFLSEELERVYTPIGLDIGAKTPEEIALSIAAELVRVRSGRQGHAT